jgi:FAD/FMN-containing dehydrogenase
MLNDNLSALHSLMGFKGEVDSSEETLIKYSHDASIFEVKPLCVVHPKHGEDVKHVVKWVVSQRQNSLTLNADDSECHPELVSGSHANRFRNKFGMTNGDKASVNKGGELSITARSAGTDMSGGPLNTGIIADFTTHFNKILNWGPNFVEVEPGVYYRDFEVETLKRGLLLPCYTASKMLNTVGGMVGNNSAGEKTLAYGQTKDFVEELSVVLSDGNEYQFSELESRELESKLRLPNFEGDIYRKIYQLIKDNRDLIQNAKPKTSKNSAGYLLWEVWDGIKFNLAKLIVGSQGTLGLVTKIRFRLVEPKPKSALLVMFLKDLNNLGEIVADVVEHKPESFESYDDKTLKLAIKFLPAMVKKMSKTAGSAFGGILNMLSLGWQFMPEAVMTLTGGMPKLVLICEFTGTSQEAVNEKASLLKREVEGKFHIQTRICQSKQEVEKYWTIRRESFSLLRERIKDRHTAPFIDDIAVLPKDMPAFLPRLNKILEKYQDKIIYTIAGHAGNGNFHIIPLMNLADENQRAIIPKLSDEVYSLVLEFGGTITAEHNDGLIRTPYLEKMYGKEVIGLFEEVKKIFDPLNIFNPGKKVHGDLGYAMEHIKRS